MELPTAKVATSSMTQRKARTRTGKARRFDPHQVPVTAGVPVVPGSCIPVELPIRLPGMSDRVSYRHPIYRVFASGTGTETFTRYFRPGKLPAPDLPGICVRYGYRNAYQVFPTG
jgi:hypothetical protein